jgi:alcohol dehydrogenase
LIKRREHMYLPGYYEYSAPVVVVSGHHCLEEIPGELRKLGASKPFIVTDQGVTSAGLLDIVTDAIRDRVNIRGIADDIPQDSDIGVVNHLAGVYREQGCDSLIALGGGSVIDTAKGINIVVSENTNDVAKFSGAGRLKRPLKPLIVIPTTAGTGSETTAVAVIADHERRRKMLFVSYFLVPDVAVLDPRMTMSLPPAMTAATAMDALCHAVEASICLAKNPLSDSAALMAIELISGNLLRVVTNPGDRDGRLALANAATLAGMAFSNSMVGMVHTLGHSVGSVCGVPHGVAMSILLPYGLEYNMHRVGAFIAALLFPLGGPEVFVRTPKRLGAEQVVSLIRRLNGYLHDATEGRHARCCREVRGRDGASMVAREKFPDIARTALGDGSLFYNPEDMVYGDMMMVMEAAWEGVPLDRGLITRR